MSSTLPGSGILSTVTSGGTVVAPTTTTSANAAPVGASAIEGGEGSTFKLTTGWYVFFGLGAGVLLSGTELAPIALGILTTALLYQITQLIEGK